MTAKAWRLLLVPVALTSFLLSSCKGSAGVDPKVPAQEEDSYGVTINTRIDCSIDEFCDFAASGFDDYLESYVSKDLNAFVNVLAQQVFTDNRSKVDKVVSGEIGCTVANVGTKWSVRIYNFTYPSTSYTGTPVNLSATLCVPVCDYKVSHELSAMSLCLPTMPYIKTFCPSENGHILMTRVAYNHAVVIPDYQGRGASEDVSPYSSFHTADHALQAIDAALAARRILEDEGFSFASDFCTYNVGVSEGGEVAYHVHKMIENDLTQEQQQTINLYDTYSANGIGQHSKYITTQLSLYTYDESMHAVNMGFYKDAFDCLSEEEKQGHNGKEFLSKDLLDENNKIILDSPIIQVLQQAVSRNDIDYNWNPRHYITLVGSYDDNDVLYEDNAVYMYELIKNDPDGIANDYVNLVGFSTPLSAAISDYVGPDYMIAHIMADVYCLAHAVLCEDPARENYYETIIYNLIRDYLL